jgi:hypothetical protein
MVKKYNDYGLPKVDAATFAAWREEAKAQPPDIEDWADLVAILRWHAELDRQGVENPKLPPRMTSIERTIFAIGGFMQRQPLLMEKDNHGAAALVVRLHRAIADLERGLVSPIFKPTKTKKGNPGLATEVEIIKGWASRAVTGLMTENNTSLHDAAQTVASALRPASRRSLGPITTETVINWREKLLRRRGRGKNPQDIAVQAYDDPLPSGFTAEHLVQALRKKASSFV